MKATLGKLSDDRRDLAASYVPWALSVAARVSRIAPERAEEARSGALLGLCEAASRFDATLCPSFTRFAERRVRGEALDAIAAMGERHRPLPDNFEPAAPDSQPVPPPEEARPWFARGGGPRKGMRTLTDDGVRAVFRLRDAGIGPQRISRVMGVCQQTIFNILRRKVYRDVEI